MIRDLRDSVRARGVETPFEDITVDANRACDLPVPRPLDGWPRVDEQSAMAHRVGHLPWLHARPVSPRLFEEPVDRAHRDNSDPPAGHCERRAHQLPGPAAPTSPMSDTDGDPDQTRLVGPAE